MPRLGMPRFPMRRCVTVASGVSNCQWLWRNLDLGKRIHKIDSFTDLTGTLTANQIPAKSWKLPPQKSCVLSEKISQNPIQTD